MPTKVFVGRLAEGTTGEDLLTLFRKFGNVKECDVISNYGFVHMDTEEEAKAAIAALDGYSVRGSHIHVELSTASTQGRKRKFEPTTPMRGNGRGERRGRYDYPSPSPRDGYADAGRRAGVSDRERGAHREEYASEQVKDLLELYFRDPYAFDQYARTYYYGERYERVARGYYDKRPPDEMYAATMPRP